MLRNVARCFRSVITEVQKLGRLNLVLIYLFDDVLLLSRLRTAHCKHGIVIVMVKHHMHKSGSSPGAPKSQWRSSRKQQQYAVIFLTKMAVDHP